MALQHIQRLHPLSSSSVKGIVLKDPTSFSPTAFLSRKIQKSAKVSCSSPCSPNLMQSSILLSGSVRRSGYRAARMIAKVKSDNGRKDGGAESSASDGVDDPFVMNEEERQELRRKIREVVDMNPDVEEEADVDERKKKMKELLTNYPLIVEEDDPNWPEDADGWGFSMGQFFDKVTIKNDKKVEDDDDENYDSEDELDWQDDNYIRPVKDISTKEWEETLFKDISPLVILVHNRYKRPKANEEIRNELENANHIIWNCGLPSPRCVAIDAVVELDLVSALGVSVFPQLLFTKAGKILYREKEFRTADELSKMMAFFYYGAAKPPCVDIAGKSEDASDIITLLRSIREGTWWSLLSPFRNLIRSSRQQHYWHNMNNHLSRKSLAFGTEVVFERPSWQTCLQSLHIHLKILHLCFELNLAYNLPKAEEMLAV